MVAGKYNYLIDSGAYSDQAAGITRAAALDCTGPYNIPNVWCDSYCMYTNHPFATSFRGYAHPEITFAVERTMDQLAKQLNIDPIQLRIINGIKPGDTTPTQVVLTANNIGDVEKCLNRAKELIEWEEVQQVDSGENKDAVKGISLFWKTSTTATNAQAGVILTFEADGSVNLNCAAIELGQGTKTILAQILAESLGMEMNKIHVTMELNTQYDPHQWRTVASSSTFFSGTCGSFRSRKCVSPTKENSGYCFTMFRRRLRSRWRSRFLKPDPAYGIEIKDIALGYTYPSGHSIEGQVVGVGKHIQRHLTPIN